MIWILLLYVLPLVLSILGAYVVVRQAKGTMGEFLEILPYLFIPIFNILAIIVGIAITVEEWLKNDENWQNFKNRKL